jgi:histidine triad (HIT) family protein
MTIFQRILEGEIPCDAVYEDELCLAFRDINPIAPCHILVIPRQFLSRLSDAKPEHDSLLGHLMRVASKVAKMDGYEDFQVLTNNGESAGQTVFHLHLHVIAGKPLRFTQ